MGIERKRNNRKIAIENGDIAPYRLFGQRGEPANDPHPARGPPVVLLPARVACVILTGYEQAIINMNEKSSCYLY